MREFTRPFIVLLVAVIPIFLTLWVWFTPLAFVPVPSPDDPVYYMPSRDLFSWPPRYTMSNGAPFEPTFRIFNFNNMPLLPSLIGLGRFAGIDGSFAIKFWPLCAWTASGVFLVWVLLRAGLPPIAGLMLALAFGMDPALRWASVVVRPESFVALFGVVLVLALTLGIPPRFQERGIWDPMAALLALAAYAHFNAIHLLFPLVLSLYKSPRRLITIGMKTFLYLLPWILAVLLHWDIFLKQLGLAFKRLSFSSNWLRTPSKASSSLFPNFWNPEPWHPLLGWAAMGLLILAGVALFWGLVIPLLQRIQISRKEKASEISLLPSAGWVLSSLWLYLSKPEVWFTYFLHVSTWTFTGVAALALWKKRHHEHSAYQALGFLGTVVAAMIAIFSYVNVYQYIQMRKDTTWQWGMYYSFIDGIDSRLSSLKSELGDPKLFRVWCPTAPDVIVELLRRHPDWQFTRTNDYRERFPLALAHANEVEAIVVTDFQERVERNISAPADRYPELVPTWMYWEYTPPHQMKIESDWKPSRYICQRGRWLAILFMKSRE